VQGEGESEEASRVTILPEDVLRVQVKRTCRSPYEQRKDAQVQREPLLKELHYLQLMCSYEYSPCLL